MNKKLDPLQIIISNNEVTKTMLSSCVEDILIACEILISSIKDGNKVFTSGKGGIFSPGIPIGEVKKEEGIIKVLLFSDLNQITFVNINLGDSKTQ